MKKHKLCKTLKDKPIEVKGRWTENRCVFFKENFLQLRLLRKFRALAWGRGRDERGPRDQSCQITHMTHPSPQCLLSTLWVSRNRSRRKVRLTKEITGWGTREAEVTEYFTTPDTGTGYSSVQREKTKGWAVRVCAYYVENKCCFRLTPLNSCQLQHPWLVSATKHQGAPEKAETCFLCPPPPQC